MSKKVKGRVKINFESEKDAKILTDTLDEMKVNYKTKKNEKDKVIEVEFPGYELYGNKCKIYENGTVTHDEDNTLKVKGFLNKLTQTFSLNKIKEKVRSNRKYKFKINEEKLEDGSIRLKLTEKININ